LLILASLFIFCVKAEEETEALPLIPVVLGAGKLLLGKLAVAKTAVATKLVATKGLFAKGLGLFGKLGSGVKGLFGKLGSGIKGLFGKGAATKGAVTAATKAATTKSLISKGATSIKSLLAKKLATTKPFVGALKTKGIALFKKIGPKILKETKDFAVGEVKSFIKSKFYNEIDKHTQGAQKYIKKKIDDASKKINDELNKKGMGLSEKDRVKLHETLFKTAKAGIKHSVDKQIDKGADILKKKGKEMFKNYKNKSSNKGKKGVSKKPTRSTKKSKRTSSKKSKRTSSKKSKRTSSKKSKRSRSSSKKSTTTSTKTTPKKTTPKPKPKPTPKPTPRRSGRRTLEFETTHKNKTEKKNSKTYERYIINRIKK